MVNDNWILKIIVIICIYIILTDLNLSIVIQAVIKLQIQNTKYNYKYNKYYYCGFLFVLG